MRRLHIIRFVHAFAIMQRLSTMRQSCFDAPLHVSRRMVANAWTNRSSLKTGDWVCTRCGFVTAAAQYRCAECKAVRDHLCALINQLACLHCKSLNHANNERCFACKLALNAQAAHGCAMSRDVRAKLRLQRVEDVRVVKQWPCSFCGVRNPHVASTCRRCHKIRAR
jgi:ribosomal protein L40E